jgi:AbiV family abortive infection protein
VIQANREIPKALIQQGIDLCKTNVSDFIKDARLVLNEGRLNHAYVITEFAIEEFGKGVILKKIRDASSKDPVDVSENVFTSHRGKSAEAWTILDPKTRIIFDEGVFQEGIFEPRVFKTNTSASHDTRLQCAFVDFKNGRWVLGREIKKTLLEDLLTHIENKLSSL